MKNSIEIEKINYFGDSFDRNFNAKVLYTKNGNLYLCHIDVDHFNKRVHVPKQPKECKVLVGFEQKMTYEYYLKFNH